MNNKGLAILFWIVVIAVLIALAGTDIYITYKANNELKIEKAQALKDLKTCELNK